MKPLRACDLFCGAGGTSTGLALACESLGVPLDLLAVNHWDRAVETHAANHPWARHLCASLDDISPRDVAKEGLDLLVASPECTHHSTARGGVPMSDQSRASAWHVLHWVDKLRPRSVLVENVPEFRSWGPLGANGRPLKSRRGETYQAWINSLESLGYRVQQRILCAADYGDPTTRKRLFVVAKRGRVAPAWPEITHAAAPGADLFNSLMQPWRTAREIIDWSNPGKSIFERARPLVENTLKRIEAGLRRFGGDAAEPFIVLLRGTAQNQVNSSARSVDEPVPTVAAKGTHVALVEPFLLQQQSGGAPRAVSRPTPTIAGKGAVSLVQPFIVPRYGERPGQSPRTHSIDAPLPTVPATCQHGVVEPFLVRYHGNGGPESIHSPVPTLTTRDRFGLVEATVQLDILFRMLQPLELARAQGFPDDYQFRGTKTEIIKLIGNAVPINTAAALCGALLRRAA